MDDRHTQLASADNLGWIGAKIMSVWALFGITTWADASYFFATVYTICLLSHWWWTTFLRPLLERMGVLKYKPKRS